MTTTAILLAADAGEGFTTPKYATPIAGVPMVRAAVDAASLWPVGDVVVVLGSDAEEVLGVIEDSDVTILIDPDWREGEAAPIRAALDLVTRDRSVDRVVVARADQPAVPADTVDALLTEAASSDADVVVPKYRYARGWPVVIGESMWRHLLASEGTYDLHAVISMHAAAIAEVWFDRLSPRSYASAESVRRLAP
ncbi:MAG: NTP transferase domain-containing protein [Acidimicrobiia bacterium]|nr:NTP transferase domain-containing protein [Acidimicrobiia bacterium]